MQNVPSLVILHCSFEVAEGMEDYFVYAFIICFVGDLFSLSSIGFSENFLSRNNRELLKVVMIDQD